MNIHELDWHRNWVRNTLAALNEGLSGVIKRYDDGDDILENANAMTGIGFVAVQVHLSATLSDLKAAFPTICPKAADLLAGESRLIPETTLTAVETMWGAANFFKHLDDIHANGRVDAGTKRFMAAFALKTTTAWPCYAVHQRIYGPSCCLFPLLDEAVDWRERWFTRLHALKASGGPP